MSILWNTLKLEYLYIKNMIKGKMEVEEDICKIQENSNITKIPVNQLGMNK